MLAILVDALALGIAIAGTAAAIASCYLVLLAVAASFPRRSAPAGAPAARLAVIVPAHDEALLIERCVSSLLAQTYPRHLYEVVVVADNCRDETAAIAAREGAGVLQRFDPQARGKGRALRWAMDQLAAGPKPPDAYVVVDADSVADPGLLWALETKLREGALAVQGEYLVLEETGSRRERLTAIGFLLFHRVRLGGRAALGLPANLVGNGMLFSRELMVRQPWDAFSGAEDLEYSSMLRLAGVRPVYAPDAKVRGPMPERAEAATEQRVRWEGGRLHVQRRFLGQLVSACLEAPPGPWDMALDLAVPPLGLLAIVALLGLGAAAALVALGAPILIALPWAVAVLGIPGFAFAGLLSARAPRSIWIALLSAPLFMAWKLIAYRRLLRGFDPERWVRSERVATRTASEVNLFGVPITRVTMEEALARLAAALGSGRLTQVATVNLDFLVSAQKRPEVREILERTEMNVADGAPIVWLTRLLGQPLPERVAGADLVPNLMRVAAERGVGVYLLGGENGAAAAAAARLRAEIPGLRIVGILEPARAAVEDMDNESILAAIEASNADILLVALGHPKQERWISLHRESLKVSVAIGVGCVFDLMAKRVNRAPGWLRAAGLEWLFRLGQEPRRLFRRYATDASWLAVMTARVLLGRVPQLP